MIYISTYLLVGIIAVISGVAGVFVIIRLIKRDKVLYDVDKIKKKRLNQ
jgi:uncharacterized membrane protein